MSGLAIAVAWEGSIEPGTVDAMLGIAPHRIVAGTSVATVGNAVLGESCSGRPGEQGIVDEDGLGIAADLRLWDTGRLRALAGGEAATRGLSHRRLLLAAYRRVGLDLLDAVDGDFAFVIWDARRRTVVAARDRFAVKPLFYELSPHGIRLASEAKQLAVVSERGPRPCPRTIVEYLDDRFEETRFTFLDGILRVRPAHVLVATPDGASESHYWETSNIAGSLDDPADVPGQFREILVESVRQRLATSPGAVGHLSGGLDSPSISASAQILATDGRLPGTFDTVSALYPGHANDETPWIRDIAAAQNRPHHEFVPEIDDVDAFSDDMWIADRPWVDRDRGFWAGTAQVAREVGADLVLTGNGGDHALYQAHLLADYLRRAWFGRWVSGIIAASRFTGTPAHEIGGRSLRTAAPAWLHRLSASRLTIRSGSIVGQSAREAIAGKAPVTHRRSWNVPTMMQNALLADVQHPILPWLNETQEAAYASGGIQLSHPFFDRDVFEFVLSIPLRAFPYDGRSKSLVRQGFAGHLPDPVLSRSSTTTTNEYLRSLFAAYAPQYRQRYPSVTAPAAPFVDEMRYDGLLRLLGAGQRLTEVQENLLWRVWSLMAWLETLDRFDPARS